MIRTLRKFFDFCGEENKKLFIASIWLGVLSAVCSAMRIPAVYIVIQSLLEKNVTIKTLMSSFAVICYINNHHQYESNYAADTCRLQELC